MRQRSEIEVRFPDRLPHVAPVVESVSSPKSFVSILVVPVYGLPGFRSFNEKIQQAEVFISFSAFQVLIRRYFSLDPLMVLPLISFLMEYLFYVMFP